MTSHRRYRLVEHANASPTGWLLCTADAAPEVGVEVQPDDDLIVLCPPGTSPEVLAEWAAPLRRAGHVVVFEGEVQRAPECLYIRLVDRSIAARKAGCSVTVTPDELEALLKVAQEAALAKLWPDLALWLAAVFAATPAEAAEMVARQR